MCFRPNEIINRFNEFDINSHIEKGFNTILIDIDNTLDIPDSKEPMTLEAKKFLYRLTKEGFKVIVVSNNTEDRVKTFLNGEDFDYSYWSFKPLPFVYFKLIKKYNLDKKKIISFGDQLLTDCLGANIVGIYSLYTKQLVTKDSNKTFLNRKLERFIFKYILHEEV